MSLLHALILGLLQGVTEFIPISSSAHLKIARQLLGIPDSEAQLLFDLTCHLGTLFALLLFLRRELLCTRLEQAKSYFLALLPLIPAYFLLKPLANLLSAPSLLGFCLMGTTLILFAGGALKLPRKTLSPRRDLLWIGASQSLALLPGISRSASTISCAKLLGWPAREAVRFSFLLSIPTIIGGNCLELLKLSLTAQPVTPLSFSVYSAGFLTSLLAGLCSVGIGFRLLEKGCFKPFAWYCLLLGVLITVYYYG